MVKKSLLVIITLMLVFLVSCGTARKVQKDAREIKTDSAATVKTDERKTEKEIDTTRTEWGKVTITEVEFYPPPVQDASDPQQDVKPPTARKGAVKSIKQTQIETGVQQTGTSKETDETKGHEQSTILGRNEEALQVRQEPTPDPYRWRYVCYIALIVLAALLYIKRAPIINWIKRILSGLRKIV